MPPEDGSLLPEVLMALHIPSPPVNGFHLGSLFIHFYGLMYVVGIALAIVITRRRWRNAGGDPALVAEVATWAVPAGILGGPALRYLSTPPPAPPHPPHPLPLLTRRSLRSRCTSIAP